MQNALQTVATPVDVFHRLRTRLTLEAPPGLNDPDLIPQRGDHDLDPVMAEIAKVRPIKPAAVLIAVVDRPDPAVLLTQRATHLSDHPGQIAFPGGKIDASDQTPLAAALREAREEIALHSDLLEPIGYLDLYMTTLGYRIVPVVARLQPHYALQLNTAEVDDAFEVPLAFLMESANHHQHQRQWQGMMRSYYAMPFEQRYIWGVTAGILRNLYTRVFAE